MFAKYVNNQILHTVWYDWLYGCYSMVYMIEHKKKTQIHTKQVC